MSYHLIAYHLKDCRPTILGGDESYLGGPNGYTYYLVPSNLVVSCGVVYITYKDIVGHRMCDTSVIPVVD